MKKHNQSGQVLLVTIMLLATVLTVVLSVSFKSTTDTQITKLEQEQQKALAAAEAAIEASLKANEDITFAGLGSEYSNFSGGATLSEARSNVFTSPLLQKDEQYTFYLQTYNTTTKSLSGNSTEEDVEVCFSPSGQQKPAIEITLIKTGEVKRYLVQPSGETIVEGNPPLIADSCSNGLFPYGATILSSDVETDAKIMLVRMINSGGKLFFKRNSVFPLQGKTILSEARSNTGVSKSVTLFQSYPQIPSEFFVSSF